MTNIFSYVLKEGKKGHVYAAPHFAHHTGSCASPVKWGIPCYIKALTVAMKRPFAPATDAADAHPLKLGHAAFFRNVQLFRPRCALKHIPELQTRHFIVVLPRCVETKLLVYLLRRHSRPEASNFYHFHRRYQSPTKSGHFLMS